MNEILKFRVDAVGPDESTESLEGDVKPFPEKLALKFVRWAPYTLDFSFFSSKGRLSSGIRVRGTQTLLGLTMVGNANRVDVQVLHGTPGIEQPCEVSCPNGDSRSGPHPCIDCQAGEYTVRVCC
jgi:hypothetical protein